MRIKRTPAALEARRLRAARLLARGKRASVVARMVGAPTSSVSRWKSILERHGPEGLRTYRGRSRLSDDQKRRVVDALRKGALAAGFDSDRWTYRRVCDLIYRTEGVWYTVIHLDRVLHRLGFSLKEDEARARRRAEKAARGSPSRVRPAPLRGVPGGDRGRGDAARANVSRSAERA